jgi:hypothetical protein
VGVFLVEFMPVDAMCLRYVVRRNRITAQKILSLCDGLKVFGVNARPIAAEMI